MVQKLNSIASHTKILLWFYFKSFQQFQIIRVPEKIGTRNIYRSNKLVTYIDHLAKTSRNQIYIGITILQLLDQFVYARRKSTNQKGKTLNSDNMNTIIDLKYLIHNLSKEKNHL